MAVYRNNEVELVVDTKSVQSNCGIDNCSSVQKKIELGKIGVVADLSVQGSLPDNVGATSVSLPPEKYNPVEYDTYAACWSNGQHAPYLHLARTFDLLEDEKGKIKSTSMLCHLFRRFVYTLCSYLIDLYILRVTYSPCFAAGE
ncbi:putative DNA ligase (ATP) [Rosa chinensis]|uniref:Putative DNA ligase (ATP) n=1 Tax=Rosa chinensis TaxID=74649 RepID=A0A2P6RGW4_ROSCH|nr:putative DNA ligase (ATP) [Rosa chinensis]